MKLPRSPVSPNHPASQELQTLDASPREASRERPRARLMHEARRRRLAVVARSLLGLPRVGGLVRGNRNCRCLDLLPPTAFSTSPPGSGIPRPPSSIPAPHPAVARKPRPIHVKSSESLLECEDSFDYVGSSSSRIRSSSKRDLGQDDHFLGYHYYHCYARCLISITCLSTYHFFVKPPKMP